MAFTKTDDKCQNRDKKGGQTGPVINNCREKTGAIVVFTGGEGGSAARSI